MKKSSNAHYNVGFSVEDQFFRSVFKYFELFFSTLMLYNVCAVEINLLSVRTYIKHFEIVLGYLHVISKHIQKQGIKDLVYCVAAA